MGVRVGNFKVVYESVIMEAINPEYLGIKEKDIREYLERHPMPVDPDYSVDEMIGDITGSSGFYTLPDNTKQETCDFIADMLNELVW